MKSENKDPLYAKYLVRFTRAFPDFDFFFIKKVREKAVHLLHLKEGDRVIDAGCGSGGSFPYIIKSVGQSGEITGIEISPATIINTKKRIQNNDWKNVIIIEADAQTVTLSGKFDALLMLSAPDVYASEKAVLNILPFLKENAGIVFFEAKISERKYGWILNGILRKAFTKLSFTSTPELETHPWKTIEGHMENLTIEEYLFGWMFLASGNLYVGGIPKDG